MIDGGPFVLRLTRRAAAATAAILIASAGTVAIVGACASFGGGATATVDDASPPLDASPLEASADGGPPDATATFSCAALQPQPTFCNDFDEAPVLAGFKLGFATGSEAGVDTTFARSPPNSFVAETPPCDQGPCSDLERAGQLAYQTPAPSRSVRAEFDLYIESASALGTGMGPQVAKLAYDNTYYVSLDLSPQAATVREVLSADGGVTVTHAFDIHAIAFAKWQRVALSVTADDAGPGGLLALSVDGKDVPLMNPQSSMAGTYRTANLVVNLGISAVYAPTDRWTVHLDDVVIDQH
jgi:hypothetical protein